MSAADDFLIAFHRQHPGCTSEAFAHGSIDGGGSSYDLLADQLPQGLSSSSKILDLGCGDGHLLQLLTARGIDAPRLIGVDMSPHELALARSRPALAGASLIEARAHELPLPDASISAVLSHLAFMLMSEAEVVVQELRRVLEPGGVFVMAIGGGPKIGDAFELFLDLLLPVVGQLGNPVPRLGDRRCRKAEGLAELLGPAAGFVGPPRIDDFSVDLSGSFDRVWRTLSTIYELYEFPAAAEAELREAFEPAALALSADGSTVPCSMFVRRVIVRRG